MIIVWDRFFGSERVEPLRALQVCFIPCNVGEERAVHVVGWKNRERLGAVYQSQLCTDYVVTVRQEEPRVVLHTRYQL